VLVRNSVKSGRKGDILKCPSLLFPLNKALIYGYFPWYLVARTMAKLESRETHNITSTAERGAECRGDG
jgi:hypothetical protein